nr:hypothetical protein [Tanacetum cinerariifolium]
VGHGRLVAGRIRGQVREVGIAHEAGFGQEAQAGGLGGGQGLAGHGGSVGVAARAVVQRALRARVGQRGDGVGAGGQRILGVGTHQRR